MTRISPLSRRWMKESSRLAEVLFHPFRTSMAPAQRTEGIDTWWLQQDPTQGTRLELHAAEGASSCWAYHTTSVDNSNFFFLTP